MNGRRDWLVIGLALLCLAMALFVAVNVSTGAYCH